MIESIGTIEKAVANINTWHHTLGNDAQWCYKTITGDLSAVSVEEFLELLNQEILTTESSVSWSSGPNLFPLGLLDFQYLYEERGETAGVFSEQELHQRAAEQRVRSYTRIWGRGLPPGGIEYRNMTLIDFEFSPPIPGFLLMRRQCQVTVISGSNNAGKTMALKLIKRELGSGALFLACNRFYHFAALEYVDNYERQRFDMERNLISQLYQTQQNSENTNYQLAQLVGHLRNEERNRLLSICSKTFGEEFSIKQVDADNLLSRYYIDVGGRNLSEASTGTRLFFLLVAALFDSTASTILVDEPEIGLSPDLQRKLAGLLYDQDAFQRAFPHIRQLFIVTHSHMFLDRNDLRNNFVISKLERKAKIENVCSIGNFHSLQFNMLGNTLESMFLPSAIVLVEGDSDQVYLTALLSKVCGLQDVAVVAVHGEGHAEKYMWFLDQSFLGFMKSPYRTRTFLLLDSTNSVVKSKIKSKGIPEKNIVVLSRNGVEYYYPSDILGSIFNARLRSHDDMVIGDNVVTLNEISYSKKDLANKVAAGVVSDTIIPDELKEKLISGIRLAIGA